MHSSQSEGIGVVRSRIGDVDLRISSSGASHLIPKGHLSALTPVSPESVGHFRWLAQKFALGQDSLLLGHPGPLRRQLVLAFAEAAGIEVEHLRLSRDTTESDLKQRRELRVESADNGASQSVIFHDQAPVRAALHGRLLLLEGLECAERNVLPTLNNLLENREMQLEDGRLLGSVALPVHPQFRVIALGLQVPPYGQGHSLDPPLRSRFQARHVDALSAESVSDVLSNRSQLLAKQAGVSVDENSYRQDERRLLSLYETMRSLRSTALTEGLPLSGLPSISLRQMEYCLGLGHSIKKSNSNNFSQRVERIAPALTWLQEGVASRLRPTLQASWENLTADITPTYANSAQQISKSNTHLTADQQRVFNSMCDDIERGQHLCLLGPRGSGKSELARELVDKISSRKSIIFPLYAELTARDLLQRRETDAAGNTAWADSPLVAMARNGGLCILDGIDRVDSHVLVVLQSLLHEGSVVLPSGEQLRAHNDFVALALGIHSTGQTRAEDVRSRYLGSELELCYHLLPPMDVPTMFQVLTSVSDNASEDLSKTFLYRTAAELSRAAGSAIPELALNLRHLLRLQRLGFAGLDTVDPSELRGALEGTMMTRFLPAGAKTAFDEALRKAGLPQSLSTSVDGKREGTSVLHVTDKAVTIGDVTSTRRIPLDPFRVPAPLFHANEQHMQFLRDMLHSYVRGEKAILLVGNQGVGKNKLIDRFLQLINAEREYIQLHRDSTLQSLTLLPTLESGRVKYQESPLVIAARTGRVLVVDEADKAPLEVVAILKSLAEDGELTLPDGRRLLRKDHWLAEQASATRDVAAKQEVAAAAAQNVLLIHEDFRLVVLANRPGMPFLGNNFFRECGDVFHAFIVENLPRDSEMALLQAYGPDVREGVLLRLTAAFAGLRKEHESGTLNYPYSAREAVAVVKHIQAYPADGALAAIENVLQFESLSPTVRARVAAVFQSNGIPVSTFAGTVVARPAVHLSPLLASPAPFKTNISRQTSVLKASWSSVILYDQPWQSASVTEQRSDLRSSRVSVFSEEAAALRVGRLEESDGRRELRAMVSQSECLHVLTTSPLELHSFLGIKLPDAESSPTLPTVDGRVTDFSQSSYVRHELLSANMGWRLGQFSPLLAPASDGVTVILPELSMALHVPNSQGANRSSADATATMLTLPDLKPFFAPQSTISSDSLPAKRGILSKLFSGGDNESVSGRQPEIKITHGLGSNEVEGFSVMWRPGMARIAVLDMKRRRLSFAILGDGGDACEILSLSLAGSKSCLVSTADGKTYSMPLAPLTQNLGESGKLTLHELVSGTSLLGDATSAYVGTLGETQNGSEAFHASVVSGSPQSGEHLFSWPRSQSTSADSKTTKEQVNLRILCSTPGDGVVHSLTSRPESGTFLEVCSVDSENTSNPLKLRRIPIGRGTPGNDQSTVVDMAQLTSTSAAVLFSDGIVRLYETDETCLQQSLDSWEAMHGPKDAGEWGIARIAPSEGGPTNDSHARLIPLDKYGRFADQTSTPKTGLDAPKHGKEDPKNEPHVGGNTWAGGTGGSDTSGLGGRGGPYRLDKGHTVHQVSDANKALVSDEARAEAARMAKEGLNRRLKEISLGKGAFGMYLEYRTRVEGEISELRGLVDEIARRAKERMWLRRQTHGELDDSRLVDGLAGDRLIYKRRGDPDKPSGAHRGNSGTPTDKKLHFVLDVSGSMYRFNGQDRRLERLLEATLLVLESMPTGTSSPLLYALSGHSGDSPEIPLLAFDDEKPKDEGAKYEVLEQMVAHSQYCMSGDYTVRAAEMAIDGIVENSDAEGTERFVIVVSDANFERYGIQPVQLEKILLKNPKVQAHMVLIASFGGEAESVVQQMPACKGRVHTCYNTSALPAIFQKILLEAIGGDVGGM